MPGGGTLAIQTSNADIGVKEHHPDLRKGLYVLLTVSDNGAGTTFRIYLPRLNREPEQPAQENPRGGNFRGSETILLVEDDEMVRALVKRGLQFFGYMVVDVRSPEEAVRIGEERGKQIRLLLTDLVMPLISGRELAGRLLGTNPAMKVLYISGYLSDAIPSSVVLEQGTPFLQKPFLVNKLAEKVREVLGAGGTEPRP